MGVRERGPNFNQLRGSAMDREWLIDRSSGCCDGGGRDDRGGRGGTDGPVKVPMLA